jgi:hypothetical protein
VPAHLSLFFWFWLGCWTYSSWLLFLLGLDVREGIKKFKSVVCVLGYRIYVLLASLDLLP